MRRLISLFYVIDLLLIGVFSSDAHKHEHSLLETQDVNEIGDYRKEDVHVLLGDANIEELGRNFQLLFTSSDHKPIILHKSPEVGCKKCDQTASVLLYLRKNLHIDKNIISDILISICKKSADKNDRICEDKINSALDQLLYIFDFGNNATPERICTLRMGPTCHNQFDYFNWTISIPDKPATVPKKLQIVQQNDQNLRVLQLSDLHLDPLYTPGARSKCGEPICCQIDQMPVNSDEETCGIWGDYEEADTPRKTFDDVLRQTRTHEDIDFVYFTGDMVGHRTWSWGKNESSIIEKEVMERLMENFDVPVLFVLGNHDSFPYNLYAPSDVEEEVSTKWVFDIMEDELKGLVTQNDLETIRKGGFYTVQLKPGFRVVVLNNNVCSLRNTKLLLGYAPIYLNEATFQQLHALHEGGITKCFYRNSWLVYDDYDPYGQLAWLVDILSKAEKNGEYVHILYHFPTGIDACLGTWSREFARIISRFSDTVTGQFSGHTHYDEFFLFYDEANSSRVVNVGFNGASLSPLSGNNPSYKIYDINGVNFRVLDFEEWIFSLDQANKNPDKESLEWYKLYSFIEAYGVNSMEPESIGKFVKRLARNKPLLEKYNKYKHRMGKEASDVCDDECNKDNLCLIVKSHVADEKPCKEIRDIYDGNRDL